MIKRSLVVVDASPRSAVRLTIARALARVHGGEVTALYSVLPTLLATPWATTEGMSGAAGLLAEVDAEQRRRAQAIFRQACDESHATWLDGSDMPYTALLRQSFVHDLLVLGQADPDDLQTGALPADLLPGIITDSGRPTLVVPAAGPFETTDGPVLVGWKPSREAASALSAALPWLRRAPLVHMAVPDATPDGEQAVHALEGWLRLQGVQAPLQRHTVADTLAGERLLSLATDVDAALLVMGCYGHNRAREWVLGGATRTVLRSMTRPVLMAH